MKKTLYAILIKDKKTSWDYVIDFENERMFVFEFRSQAERMQKQFKKWYPKTESKIVALNLK